MNEDDKILPPQSTPASQSTQIEQARAVAEVQAALTVAKASPRYEIGARAAMIEACKNPILAEAAFFSYPRGGETIVGPTIHLATELARCWGNMDYGIKELSRDDGKGESELMAHAWDLQTNTRTVLNFLVPHRRDTRNGTKLLTDLRDVYENNFNMGARRLRECIFRALPKAFRDEAVEVCRQTIEHGGGVSIADRRVQLLEAFAGFDVTREQLERKAGHVIDHFSAFDIASLRIVYGSIKRGETNVDTEFDGDAGADLTKEIEAAAPAIAAKPDAATKPETEAETSTETDPPVDEAVPADWRPVAKEAHQALANATSSEDMPALLELYVARLIETEAPDEAMAEFRNEHRNRDLKLQQQGGRAR